jgi:hypothetical protein
MAAAKGVSTTAAGMSAAAGMSPSTAPSTAAATATATAMSAATSAVLRKRRPSAGQDQSQRA